MSSIAEANAGNTAAAMAAESLVIFRLGDQKCALNISDVERVVRAVEITPLPEAPPAVLGVINVQGTIVPVLDLRARFGLPPRSLSLDDHILLVKTRHRLAGLVADEVLGVTGTGDSEMVPSGDILPGLTGIDGALRLNGEVVFIYKLDHFLSLEDEEKLARAIALPPDDSQDS